MATPSILIEQVTLGAGTVEVSRVDGVVNQVVTCTDEANLGGGTHLWTVVPPPGVALPALSGTTTATLTFTPADPGTWLIFKEFTGEYSWTATADSQRQSTQGGFAILLPNGTRPFGVGETLQFNATEGYANAGAEIFDILDGVRPILPVGTSGQVLKSNGTDPVWEDADDPSLYLLTDGTREMSAPLAVTDGNATISTVGATAGVLAAKGAAGGGSESVTLGAAGIVAGLVTAVAGGSASLSNSSEGGLVVGAVYGNASGRVGTMSAIGPGAWAGGAAIGFTADGEIVAGDGVTAAFAFGNCSNGTLEATGSGAWAGGRVSTGTLGVGIRSTGNGALAFGEAQGGDILASNRGSVAIGATGGTGEIVASGVGSLAVGWATTGEAIEATATSSVQFGPGTNGTAESVQIGSGILLKADGVGVYQGMQYGVVRELTDAATIAVALAGSVSSNSYKVTITADRILGNPTNVVEGMQWTVRVIQDGTGGWALTFDTNYVGDITVDTSTDTAGQETYLTFVALSATKIMVVAGLQGL